MGRWSY